MCKCTDSAYVYFPNPPFSSVLPWASLMNWRNSRILELELLWKLLLYLSIFQDRKLWPKIGSTVYLRSYVKQEKYHLRELLDPKLEMPAGSPWAEPFWILRKVQRSRNTALVAHGTNWQEISGVCPLGWTTFSLVHPSSHYSVLALALLF